MAMCWSYLRLMPMSTSLAIKVGGHLLMLTSPAITVGGHLGHVLVLLEAHADVNIISDKGWWTSADVNITSDNGWWTSADVNITSDNGWWTSWPCAGLT